MLILKNVSKKLGEFHMNDIDLKISEGTYYVLLGRSGSGKTQLLELIAGLTRPDSGEIWLDGENITEKKIQGRRIGLVFQDYAIFPNMTVFGNIAYSISTGKIDKSIIRERVRKVAGELNISHLLDRDTHHLSGGELQRVALARTLITSPRLLLLDEPMASIDASLKDDIKRLLRSLNKQGLTIIHVTHDYREAVSLASRVGVIHNGRIIQEGKPDDVFRKPVNKFVARYSGIRNFFRVEFKKDNGEWKALCKDKLVFNLSENSYPEEGLLILRSDDIKISLKMLSSLSCNCFKGIVREILPSEYGMEITVDAGEIFYVDISADTYKQQPVCELSEVWISFLPEAGIALQGSN
ncbi:MAG TPA: ABC transporter ATP-binding protein [Bacteroidales bacterium]|nr:ABC transporter ATP-binding protein [Bacteroidales bacterium]